MSTNRLIKRLQGDDRVDLLRFATETGFSPYFRVMESVTKPVVSVEGSDKIMLGSNNYLGLADHPTIRRGAQDALDRFGAAVTGSRLLNGTIDLHVELEHEIAQWHGTEDALVFTTGYQTNLGTISAIVGRGDRVVLDSAAHASLRDGALLSGATIEKFRHNDVADLERVLSMQIDGDGAVLVVVDGLYSMEGDLAPMDSIANLCARYDAALMVDEAHSLGVFGPNRTGVAELFGVGDAVDVKMASLSKGPSSTGGFITGSADLIYSLRLHARAFLFTTSGVPASVGASLAAVKLIRSQEGADRADRVLTNARILRDGLAAGGVDVVGTSPTPGGEVVSPIVSVRVGEDMLAVGLWNTLFEKGVFASAALHPAVPKNAALMRLCVMADHSEAQLAKAVEIIAETVAANKAWV